MLRARRQLRFRTWPLRRVHDLCRRSVDARRTGGRTIDTGTGRRIQLSYSDPARGIGQDADASRRGAGELVGRHRPAVSRAAPADGRSILPEVADRRVAEAV